MADFVARANIEHYRNLLAAEKDEAKRQTLLKLLAEEEIKLAAVLTAEKNKKTR